jgi:hypothetical protein
LLFSFYWYQLLQILQKYGEIDHFNYVYNIAGQPKGFAFIKYKEVKNYFFTIYFYSQLSPPHFQAEDTINALTKLNNKKIGSKNVAVRYAKHIEPDDDGKRSGIKIPALAASSGSSSSKASLADKKNKILLIEEQLKNLQKASDDFELNSEKTLAEPLIKKYQFNKEKPTTSSSSRFSSYKRKRKPY